MTIFWPLYLFFFWNGCLIDSSTIGFTGKMTLPCCSTWWIGLLGWGSEIFSVCMQQQLIIIIYFVFSVYFLVQRPIEFVFWDSVLGSPELWDTPVCVWDVPDWRGHQGPEGASAAADQTMQQVWCTQTHTDKKLTIVAKSSKILSASKLFI